jgi:hypothetical protein
MFNIDPSTILLLFVVGPVVALVSFDILTADSFDTLPHRRWLMKLPAYAFLYRRCDGCTDLPDRSIRATLAWLAGLYLSVLAVITPFANKLLGMLVWLFSQPSQQIVLVLFFDLCILAVGYFSIKIAKGMKARASTRFHYLPLVGLCFLLGVSAFYAMSSGVELTVALSCKTIAGGIFGFLFFGALLVSVNQTSAGTATGGLGSYLANVFLALLTFGSLASIVI